jgi:hypothetical protein
VGVALLCAAAQAVIVDDDYEIGSGPSLFRVALIADPHNDTHNLRAAKDAINELVVPWNIQMVIVLGDLCSTNYDTAELDRTKGILDELRVPYVPVIGNHDMVPYYLQPPVPARDSDSIFTTRYFDNVFDTVYDALQADSYPQIREFKRYEEHAWNFKIQWPRGACPSVS